MSENRKVLVTGAAGFLGRPLCELLQQKGYHVVAVDRMDTTGPWHQLLQRDLTDPVAFDGLCDGVAVVFHLAAKTHAVATSPDDAADYQRLNVDLTDRLVDCAVAAGVQSLVFMSSVKVLGEGSAEPLTDTNAPQPTSPYGQTKLAAENLIQTAGREQGLHTSVLRAPLMYGPGVKGNLQNMVAAIAAGRFPPLPETGNQRTMVDVRDVAAALVLAAETPAAGGKAYVVTDGRAYSTREIQDLIRRALDLQPLHWSLPRVFFSVLAAVGDGLQRVGAPFPFDSTANDKLLGSAVYTSAAIESELGFRPKYTLDQALSDMVG